MNVDKKNSENLNNSKVFPRVAVLLAGGKGTRLGELAKEIPKPMIPIDGKPLLERQIEWLKGEGVQKFFILSGHLGQVIESYFQDGSAWGVEIQHVIEKEALGTAGALEQLKTHIAQPFWVIYGDLIADLNLQKVFDFHHHKEAFGTLVVHPNDHPFDSDLVQVDGSLQITRFLTKPHPENLIFRNLVNAAVYLLEPEFFKFLPQGVKGDIARDIFPAAIQKEPFYAYNSPEYLKDMGTPDRLAKVTQDFTSGKVKALRIENPRPTVFLDRDGVVIEYVPEIHKIEDVKLREGVAEAIHKLNQKGFLVIVATNQPMIAKGFLTEEELHQIHAKIETLISEEGAWIDRFYYCPHHPEKGFAGEVKELKIRCDCRKPGTGMLEQASQDYCINKESSFMIGDTWRDVECGKRFSLNAIGLMGGAGFPYSEEVIQKQTSEAADKLSSYQPQNLFKNLSEAAEFILQKFNKNSQQK